MAVQTFFPIISNSPGNAVTLTTTQHQEIVLGNRVLFRIVSTQGVNVRFSADGSTASASDMYLPANTPQIFDMGDQNNTISIYNSSASTATVWVNAVSKA